MANRHTGFKWTEKQLQTLKDRYAKDGPTKLSKELGIPYWVLLSKAKRLGIAATRKRPPKGFKWTDEMVAMLQDRYVSEGGAPIAAQLGVAIGCVQRKAASLGLHTIAGHAVAGRLRAVRNESFNIRYFDEWTPNMAYILGFLFADGSVDRHKHSVTVGLKTEDGAVLEFIKKELDWKLDIKQRKAKGNDKPQSVMTISSTIMVEDLAKKGLLPRKTYENHPFPDVPDKMMPHFVRGYLDGDGTVCIYANGKLGATVCCVGFIGSPRFVHGLYRSLLRLAGLSNKTIQFHGMDTTPHCSIAWTALNDMRLFYKFAYPKGFEFCLERKRKKLADWLAGKNIT